LNSGPKSVFCRAETSRGSVRCIDNAVCLPKNRRSHELEGSERSSVGQCCEVLRSDAKLLENVAGVAKTVNAKQKHMIRLVPQRELSFYGLVVTILQELLRSPLCGLQLSDVHLEFSSEYEASEIPPCTPY
jgi:hypothetical protein